MNINRNNYEEYFLLYTDNELSVAERNMVDTFVAANPDLQEELLMLQQSVVKPMEVDFPGKAGLLKPETINTATEEKLLLLLDNELKGKEKAAVLSLIQYNNAVKKEWEILQQTKLAVADNIIFNHKPLLYKKEEGKVVAIKWWRIAAAAMLIGFGLWGTVSYLNTANQEGTVGKTAGVEAKSQTGNAAKTGSADEDSSQTVAADQMAGIVNTVNAKTENAVNDVANTKQPAVKNNLVQPKEKPVQRDNTNPTAGIEEKEKENDRLLLETINKEERNKEIYVAVQPETKSNITEGIIDNSSAVKNTIAINTSVKNDTGDNETFVFDPEEDKPRKTKLGGFFKRVKRVLERKTKIKTGNDDEVRIANMSFAMQ